MNVGDTCTDCGELGICEKCVRRIRLMDGRCPDCGEYRCVCGKNRDEGHKALQEENRRHGEWLRNRNHS